MYKYKRQLQKILVTSHNVAKYTNVWLSVVSQKRRFGVHKQPLQFFAGEGGDYISKIGFSR